MAEAITVPGGLNHYFFAKTKLGTYAGRSAMSDDAVSDPVLQFFHSATAYDIMPENGKASVADSMTQKRETRIFP